MSVSTSASDPIILKILNGVQSGVEVSLADATYSLGSGAGDDIQLIDVSLLAGHARLRIGGAKAEIAAAAGPLTTSAHGVLAPNSDWHALEPLEIVTAGTTRFALGPRSANWATVGDDSSQGHAGGGRPETKAGAKPPARPMERLKVIALPAVALTLLALFAGWYVVSGKMRLELGRGARRSDVEVVRSALNQFPFGRRIATRQEVDGAIYVTGYVDSPVERRALSAALDKTDIPVRLRLQVLQSMRNDIAQLIAAEKVNVTFDLTDQGVVILKGLILNQATADTFADRLKDQVLGIASVVSQVKTGNSLLKDVQGLVDASQLKPWLLLRLDSDLIEVSGALPTYKVDAWVGFLQSYEHRFAADIGLRSFVQLQTPEGKLLPAPTSAITLGKDARSGGVPLDPGKLAAGTFKLGDVLVGAGAAGAQQARAPARAPGDSLDAAAGPGSEGARASLSASPTDAAGPGPVSATASLGASPTDAAAPGSVGARASLGAAPTDAAGPESAGAVPSAGTSPVSDPSSAEVGQKPGQIPYRQPPHSAGSPGDGRSQSAGGSAFDLMKSLMTEAAAATSTGTAASPPAHPTPDKPAQPKAVIASGGAEADGSPPATVGPPNTPSAPKAQGGNAARNETSGATKGVNARNRSVEAKEPVAVEVVKPGAAPDKDNPPDAKNLDREVAGQLADGARTILARFQTKGLLKEPGGSPIVEAMIALNAGLGDPSGQPSVPDWYLPLLQSTKPTPEGFSPCWQGTDLDARSLLPALFWLDLLSASDKLSLDSFTRGQQVLLLEVMLDPHYVADCAKQWKPAAKAAAASLFLREVERNPGFVRFLTRSLPSFALDIAGASLGQKRFILTKTGAKMYEGAAPDRGSRIALVGELGLVIQSNGGLSTVIFGVDIDWRVSDR